MTLALWVNPDSSGSEQIILQQGHTPAESNALYLNTGGELCFRGGSEQYCSSVQVPPYVWTHIAAVGDTATEWKLFVNGSAVWGGTVSDAASSVSGFFIGDSFYGNISDVRLYSRPLSVLEIQALVQQSNRYIRVSSSGLYSGDMGGVAGADTICQSEYGSRYKALLVAEDGSRRACQSPDCSVGTANGDGVIPDGEILYNPVAESSMRVWTGLGGGWVTDGTCHSWTETYSPGGIQGDASGVDHSWMFGYGFVACSSDGHLYCVEQ